MGEKVPIQLGTSPFDFNWELVYIAYQILKLMSTIKNIIFDFGDVLIDLDKIKFQNRLESFLGVHTPQQRNLIEDIFIALEIGAVTIDEMNTQISDVMGRPISGDKMIAVYNSMLLYIKPERFDLLESLKSQYKIYLLSNTNIIHLSWIYDYLDREYSMLNFDERFFVKTYYSHIIGLRKPNRDIYDFVLQDANLIASETMFIDDNADNIQMAKEVGIKGILHDPKIDITTSFEKYILTNT